MTEITESSGCVFCDLNIRANKTGGVWLHILPERWPYYEERAVECTNPPKPKQAGRTMR